MKLKATELPTEVWEILPLNSKLRMRFIAELAGVKAAQPAELSR